MSVAEAPRSDRSTIRDLVALTALPSLWSNQRIPAIVTALADAMLSMLRLELCCVQATSADDAPCRAARCARPDVPEAAAVAVFEPWLAGAPTREVQNVAAPWGGPSLRVLSTPFGVGGEHGVLFAASSRTDFPTDEERTLLGVAANLAAITIRDVRARERERSATREAREAAAVVETINRIGQMLAGQKDVKELVQAVTEEATRLTGAQFGAFFYNVATDRDGSYMLYTIAGASREAFARFPMPRATELFGPTFRGEGIIRIADVRTDRRYGRNPPHHGMPAGHLPVRSYLAVPVVSRAGDVIGGLFFGHEQPGVFSERVEAIMAGVASQTAIAIDNARLFEKEQQARAAAEAANRAKDEFLAVLSHELRTPLNAVYGWARMLRAGQLAPAAAVQALDVITRNAEAQTQLIDDMLDVARIVSGKLRLDVRPIDLAPVIEAAVDAVRPAAEAKAVRLEVALDPDAGAVRGDPDRLQQVVWNLVINGVKFTPRGGRVQVRLARVDAFAEISVLDTGQGISRDMLPHLFERFRQAETGANRSHGGLGLGLALVRHLVELHGGTVAAHSVGEGLGATFTVRIPVSAGVTAKAAHGPHRARTAHEADFGLPSLRGVRILVVDDHADSRDLVATILAAAGAEVRTCGSALDGFAELLSWRPDVIVSDLEMPGEDGYALMRRIRALDPTAGGRTPAIALTAYGRVQDRQRTQAAGYEIHMPKPVDPLALAHAVTGLVSRAPK